MSEGVISLVAALEDSDRGVVRAAVDKLVAAGPRPEILEGLLQQLNDPKKKHHWVVAYTLAQLTTPSPGCLEVLLEGLGGEDRDIRWATQSLLARLGQQDQKIITEVVRLLKSGSARQRRMAVYCLRDLDREGDRFTAPLLEGLEDSDPLVRVAGITAVAKKRNAGVVVKLEVLASHDPDRRVRNAAKFALERLGFPDQKKALATP